MSIKFRQRLLQLSGKLRVVCTESNLRWRISRLVSIRRYGGSADAKADFEKTKPGAAHAARSLNMLRKVLLPGDIFAVFAKIEKIKNRGRTFYEYPRF